MKIGLFTFAAVYSIFALSAQARGGTGVGGGGNDIALYFLQELSNAVTQIQSSDVSLAQQLDGPSLLKAGQTAIVVVVDTPLVVTLNGINQPCVATNDPATGLIQINQSQWNSISDPHIKEGIALHEVLSLEGKEGTGRYLFSSQYVAQFGLPGSVLSPVPNCGDSTRFSPGSRNFDGSCAFDVPMVWADDGWRPLAQIDSTGTASNESAVGFCAAQGMSLVSVDQAGCDSTSVCAEPAAILSTSGSLLDINQTTASVSGVILKETCR